MAINRQLAVTYAKRWALGTNSDYPRYGNDCTGFVSQCMLAGGWQMVGDHSFWDRKANNVWWFGGSLLTNASYTWGGAQNFANFVAASGRGRQVTDASMLEVADIVQLKNGGGIYHTMIVTKKESNDLLLSYHTSDHLDESLADILSRSGDSVAAVYWKIN